MRMCYILVNGLNYKDGEEQMNFQRFLNKLTVGAISLAGLLAFSAPALADNTADQVLSGEFTNTAVHELTRPLVAVGDRDLPEGFDIVKGSDGLDYAVTDIEAPVEAALVEMSVDEDRRKEADSADLDVVSYEDIDFNDVTTLQSALNNEDFPFVEDVVPLYDMDPKQQAKSQLTPEEHVEWSSMNEEHFVSRILALTDNINDVPTTYQALGAKVAAARASNVYSYTEVYDFKYWIKGPTVIPNYVNGVWYTQPGYWMHKIDGNIAFCLQPSVSISSNPTYKNSGTGSQPAEIYKALRMYSKITNDIAKLPAGTDKTKRTQAAWFAAQLYIWTKTKTPIWTTPNTTTFINTTLEFGSEHRRALTIAYFDQMKNGVANLVDITTTTPNSTVTLNAGSSATFNVNSAYDLRVDSVSGTGITTSDVTINNDNTVTVKTKATQAGATLTFTLVRGASTSELNRKPSTVYTSTNSQDMISGAGWNHKKTFTVKVNPPKGYVKVKKTGHWDGALSGAVFNFSWGGTSKNITTDANGEALLPDALPAGTVVKVQEVSAPTGYNVSSTVTDVTIKAGTTETVSRKNTLKTGTPAVVKKNSATGALLEGAKYKFSWDNTSKTVTTDSNGYAAVSGILHGTVVTVQEIEAPYGFDLDSTAFKVTIKGGETTTTTRTNNPSKGYAQVIKTGDVNGEALQGVTFDLYASNKTTKVRTGLKTDANGKILVSDLTFGAYYFKETAGVSGYAPDGNFYGVTVGAGNKVSTSPASVSVVNTYAQPSISKKVSDLDEKSVVANTWSAQSNDYLQYDLTTSTIARPGSSSLSSFVLTDNISGTHVDVSDVQVYTGGTNVTSQFSITKTANTVTASAKADTLTSAGFYGKAYTLRTTMKLKASILSSTSKGSFVITRNGSLVFTGSKLKPAAKVSNNVDTTLRAYTVTVNHVNEKKVNPPLKVVTEVKYNGESYRYEPFTNLKDTDGSTFKSSTILTGTVTGDVTLIIPYHIPVYEINVDEIIIDTNKASSGLPVTFKLSERKEYPNELSKIKYRLHVYDVDNGNKVVFVKDMAVASFASEIKGVLKNTEWSKNKQVNLKVEVSRPHENPEGNRFITASSDIRTQGFTASEKVLDNSNIGTTYKKEIQTTKKRTESNVSKKFETITYNFDTSVTSKTGYGFSVEIDPVYTNELGVSVGLDMGAVIDDSLLVDETQLISELTKTGSYYRLPLDTPSPTKTTSGGVVTNRFKATMPDVYVEPNTGRLSLKSSTWGNAVSGGRHFYIPIWMESLTDNHVLTVASKAFGSNFMTFGVEKTINLTAYMYGAQQNETIESDELVVKPIKQVSDVPSDWSTAWKDWIKSGL